ncbi:MAG: hypothetical protein D6732_18800 [Methanobacteriota archaeon]|nr:MAG: hypothetical protein D6732_18800 [Euryarchaeota archaeon]
MTMLMQRGLPHIALPPSEWYIMRLLPFLVVGLMAFPLMSSANVVSVGKSPSLEDLMLKYVPFAGSGFDAVDEIIPNLAGGYLVLGRTNSPELTSYNAPDYTWLDNSGLTDLFLANLSENGEILSLSRFGIDDCCASIQIGADGSFYLAGSTEKNSFPLENLRTIGFPGQSDEGDVSNVFFMKLNPDFTIRWINIIGGSKGDFVNSLALDREGNVFLAGTTISPDFPLQNASDSTNDNGLDVFLMKFSADGSLVWSTLFGGLYDELAYQITIDENENIYMVGYANSLTFPFTPPLANTDLGEDFFAVKFDRSGNVVWAQFLDNDPWVGFWFGGMTTTGNGTLLINLGRPFHTLDEILQYYDEVYFSQKPEPDDFPEKDNQDHTFYMDVNSLVIFPPDGEGQKKLGYGLFPLFGQIQVDYRRNIYMVGYQPSTEVSLFITNSSGFPLYLTNTDLKEDTVKKTTSFAVQEKRIAIAGINNYTTGITSDMDGFIVVLRNPKHQSLNSQTTAHPSAAFLRLRFLIVLWPVLLIIKKRRIWLLRS